MAHVWHEYPINLDIISVSFSVLWMPVELRVIKKDVNLGMSRRDLLFKDKTLKEC
jgi:hypothetical protein